MNKSEAKLAGWVCAAVAFGLVVWLWSDGQKVNLASAPDGRTPVTKPYPREREERNTRLKNPREEFVAARERGLTEEEVRRVVEDFVAMNLNPKSPDPTADPEDARKEWKRREQWYLDTLVSGFGLSDQQRKQAAARLRELGEREFNEYQEFLANRKALNEEAARLGGVNRWGIMEILGTEGWLFRDARAPWKLCDLDEEQRQMVGYADEKGEWVWISGGKMTKDFGTDERYENLDNRQTSQNGFITPAGKVFPLSMDQVDRIRSANVIHVNHLNQGDRIVEINREITLVARLGLLPYAKLLSEPQLRTFLLCRPDMAVQLNEELAKRSVIPKR